MATDRAARETAGWIVLTSVVCAAAIGVVVVLESMIDAPGNAFRLGLWWVAYALFVVTLIAIHGWLPWPRVRSPHLPLGVLIGLAALLVLLLPDQTWMLTLFVMTAAMAAFFWPPRAVALLIAAQILLTLGIAVTGGRSVAELVLAIVGFGNFQVFGALVVFAVRSEAKARQDLAVAHAELRATSALLELTTREAERLRIARDLHDLAGHDLTALSLELEVAGHLTADGAARQHLQRAKTIAKDLLGSIRAAVGTMRGETPSLEPALRALTADIPGLDVAVHVDRDIAVDGDRVIVILRSVQEGITNVLRHSGAERARVVVEMRGGDVLLTISDQGRGVDDIVPGHGLTGMRERFEALGGRLELSSVVGKGMTVTGTLPRSEPASPGS
ncbi:sensor histidine kinase [Microbacterium sp.]|uniref:sensor histidine kinase n=1 Tax=Microbacterium sp. TaxID=51671 RepID=UPI002810BE7E|nr:sensor histidine kinase [Microbacterium sp.]